MLSPSFSNTKGIGLKKKNSKMMYHQRLSMMKKWVSTSRSSKVPVYLTHCSSHKGSPTHPTLPKMDSIPGFSGFS